MDAILRTSKKKSYIVLKPRPIKSIELIKIERKREDVPKDNKYMGKEKFISSENYIG